MGKISFNQIDKYMNYCKENNKLETVVSLGDGNEKIDVVLRKYISIEEQTELIGTIIRDVFKNGKYSAYAYKILHDTALLTYFTNIKTTSITSERIMFLLYETNIIEAIYAFCKQVYDIDDTLSELIADKKQEIRNDYKAEYEKLRDQLLEEQDEVVAKLEEFIEIYSNLSKGLEGVDISALLADINKIANLDDKSLVYNVLETKRENGELRRETE